MIKYIPIQCQSAIHKVKGGFPYSYDVNIYRGCEHGCLYCYALYSHDYLNDHSFHQHIYYKENVCEILEKELSSPKWKKETINFGSVCDSYQPCEKDFQLMRNILKLMIKYQNPINISTKSHLILRDIDLIEELSQITKVNITCSIICADETIQKFLEPHASSSLKRMKVLQILKQKTHAQVGILMMPIIPYLTDSYSNMEAIYKLTYEIGIDYIIPGTLYLRGKTKPYFLHCLKKQDELLFQRINSLYLKGSCSSYYKNQIYQKLNDIKKRYSL